MIARWFGFAKRGTSAAVEVRAGVATFMVMAYIIFVNPAVLGYVGVPGLEGKGLPFTATLTVTGLRQIGGADIIATSSEITDATGAVVCTGKATLVHSAGTEGAA